LKITRLSLYSVWQNPTISRIGNFRRVQVKVAFIVHPISGNATSPESLSTHIFVHEVARRLARDHVALVYTEPGGGMIQGTEWRDGVKYRRIPVPTHCRRWQQLISKTPVLWRLRERISFKSPWYYAGYALQVAADVKRQQCDVVHIINLSQFAPIIRALNPTVKIVLHMHCEWLTRLDRRKIKARLRSVDRILSCSNFVTEQIRHAFPSYADRCATVYNGVDTVAFSPCEVRRADKDGAMQLLFVGAVAPYKGLHVLIDALAAVVKRCPGVQLEITGPAGYMLPLDWLPTLGEPGEMSKLTRFYDGRAYRVHLEEQIRSLGLEDRVSFSGLLPRSELPKRFRSADIFVFPSVWNELFGIPLAESMSAGVPIVATRVAGIPEVVEEGKTGLLVERGNASALAEAILRLLEDDHLRNSMGQAGRQRVLENFSWETITENVLSEYRKAGSTARRVRAA
jgi:glycosyltransferase involved in cell wall biosynthesis